MSGENLTRPVGEGTSLRRLSREIYTPEERRLLKKRRLRGDRRSYLYLLKNLRLKELRNFRFTKRRVPCGEGFYKGKDAALIRKPRKVPIPPYFEMETTTICNKRCVICENIYWKKGDQERRHLTFEEFKHIVDQFPKVRWVNLTGEGSAFLNPEYPRMLRYLWEKHRTSIWLVDHLCDIGFDRLREEILPYVHGIYVSMDAATKETYEAIKIGCSFENAIECLKQLIAYKRKFRTPFPHLTFRYVITKDNVQEIPAFVDLINSLADPHEWGGSSSKIEFTGLLVFDQISHHYVDRIPTWVVEELKKRKHGIEFQFVHAEETSLPPIERCKAWLEPYIMLPGWVLPCCAVLMNNNRPLLRKYAFGNLFEETMEEVWRHPYYMEFKAMINDPEKPVPRLCAGCRAYRTKHRIEKYGIWDEHR